MLYFAYGSNLERADLHRWCEAKSLPPLQLETVGIAYLADRRLAFTHYSRARGGGVLDIPRQRGSAVAGVMFRVSRARDREALDRKEGEGHTYRRVAWSALDETGGEHAVVTFEVEPEQREPFVQPAESYLQIVRQGYAAHDLDLACLDDAARNVPHPGSVAGLFVYGTLMQKEERHPALVRHRARFEGPGYAAGTLLDFGDYPGLVPVPSTCPVRGELYAADDRDALFRDLDAIEAFRGWGAAGSHYRRAVVRVALRDGGSVLAWTYLFAGGRDARGTIASGDWRRRQHVP